MSYKTSKKTTDSFEEKLIAAREQKKTREVREASLKQLGGGDRHAEIMEITHLFDKGLIDFDEARANVAKYLTVLKGSI